MLELTFASTMALPYLHLRFRHMTSSTFELGLNWHTKHSSSLPVLTLLNETDNIVDQVKRLRAGQVPLDRVPLVIHQDLLKVPRDVGALYRRPKDHGSCLTNNTTGERTAGLEWIDNEKSWVSRISLSFMYVICTQIIMTLLILLVAFSRRPERR